MQLLFAENHDLFLQFMEMLFRRLLIQPGSAVLPVTVKASASYVYNALPSWTHACIVDIGNHTESSSSLTTERAFSPSHYKNKPVTKVRVQPPTFDASDNDRRVASAAEFDAAMMEASRCSQPASPTAKKSNAYFMMRAALVAVAKVRRQNALDVVVVPCMGAVTPETALSMYAATSEFFKLQ